jgi:hypothetical protein
LSTPYARWTSLRITAPITAILLLPRWRKPSAHRITFLWNHTP